MTKIDQNLQVTVNRTYQAGEKQVAMLDREAVAGYDISYVINYLLCYK